MTLMMTLMVPMMTKDCQMRFAMNTHTECFRDYQMVFFSRRFSAMKFTINRRRRPSADEEGVGRRRLNQNKRQLHLLGDQNSLQKEDEAVKHGRRIVSVQETKMLGKEDHGYVKCAADNIMQCVFVEVNRSS